MDSTIKIPLSRGKVALIDGSDFDKVKDFQWNAQNRPRPYVNGITRTGKVVYMHRVITGAKAGQMVDHINGDVLDNRKRNLRLVTPAQNNWNVRKRKNKTTDFLGVSKKRNRYRAQLQHRGKDIHLGTFDNPYEAAVRYDMYKKRIAGEYGSYNFDEICDLRRLMFLIKFSAGNITVVFRKRTDRTVRILKCRVSDKQYTSKAHAKAVEEKGLLLVKDLKLNEFRFISTDSIIAVKTEDKFYGRKLKPYIRKVLDDEV
jgi:hypothetical protein